MRGVRTPERVLKPREWNDRRGQYRPTTGFSRDVPEASLGDAGHRMLKHETGDQRGDRRYAPYNRNANFSNGNS
jgi:hypothetical protein